MMIHLTQCLLSRKSFSQTHLTKSQFSGALCSEANNPKQKRWLSSTLVSAFELQMFNYCVNSASNHYHSRKNISP